MRKWIGVCLISGLLAAVMTGDTRETIPPIVSPSWPQSGVASWYGAAHQGKQTASGELFDKNKLTGAHRTLSFGTRLRVTNLTNQRTVTVRINDRGPGVSGRLIDISEAAAHRLGFIRAGLARVQIEIVSKN